jgi:predicted acylesterase/phospholipase RssA
LRVFAFAGGALDTVIQLGITHALLVSKGKAPDVVAGVSAGAINAVALAEILQAGRLTHPPRPGDELQARQQLQALRFEDRRPITGNAGLRVGNLIPLSRTKSEQAQGKCWFRSGDVL